MLRLRDQAEAEATNGKVSIFIWQCVRWVSCFPAEKPESPRKSVHARLGAFNRHVQLRDKSDVSRKRDDVTTDRRDVTVAIRRVIQNDVVSVDGMPGIVCVLGHNAKIDN